MGASACSFAPLVSQVRNSEAVSRVRRWLSDGCSPTEAAQRLAEYSIKMDSGDCVSVMSCVSAHALWPALTQTEAPHVTCLL
eukprot:scaffold59723_cov18-Tisochrysis_lutea.AAC.1